jgi:hypothetical protein
MCDIFIYFKQYLQSFILHVTILGLSYTSAILLNVFVVSCIIVINICMQLIPGLCVQ